jgi:hypothetical protein
MGTINAIETELPHHHRYADAHRSACYLGFAGARAAPRLRHTGRARDPAEDGEVRVDMDLQYWQMRPSDERAL